MKEEEQLALAFMMSVKDADEECTSGQDEEELMNKALKESLQMHNPSRKHAAADSLSAESQHELESYTSCGLTESDMADNVLSPLVVLEKLSEDVVRCSQESSIILSPEKELCLSTRSLVRNLHVGNNHSRVNVSPCQCVDSTTQLTPTKAVRKLKNASSQLCVQNCRSNTPSTSDHFSNPELKLAERQDNVDCSGCHQPVVENFQQTLPILKDKSGRELQSSEQLCMWSEWSGAVPIKNHSQEGLSTSLDGVVHYFWGIPFCPSGLNPDQYTRVILCQLETYEQCLKREQSHLLWKLEFGGPVLPALVPRDGQQPRRKLLASMETIATVNQDQESDRENKQDRERQEEQSTPECSSDSKESIEDAQKGFETGQGWSVDGNSRQKSPNLFIEESPEVNDEANSEQVESEERDVGSSVSVDVQPEDDVLFICAETQQSSSEDVQPERKKLQEPDMVLDQEPTDILLIDDDSEGLCPVTSKKTCVECPLCGQRFPLVKIEVHAANCNGTRHTEWQVRTRSKLRKAGKEIGTDGYNSSIFNQ
ncbi:BRCA1-A complex subunit RAP80 isoform X2 [Stegostoma tigrinum]|uniref:BRCA1-A complex subunit RAP80 isoform X1 n=1 Tax=Stegostoma tigrinum TaxID=3053191 RepID=UPI00286FEB6D|nr:BRCA1-A complex subunit RAP80 isoform X1 [Stegostoma tigrinum]XP_059506743.1 BRCA1-A complex subunit RAP80 isoform X2 [Stegostoma tigrinum]